MSQLQSYCTDNQSPHRRLDYWNDATSSVLTSMIAKPFDQQTFYGKMTCLELDTLRLVELKASGSVVTRTKAQAGSSSQAVYLMRLVLNGELATVQDDREIRLRPGDFVMCDATRPYQVSFRGTSHILNVRILHDHLLQYIASPESIIGIRMAGDSGLSGFASRQLRELWRASSDFVAHGAHARMAGLTMQLLASAYSQIPRVKLGPAHLRVSTRTQIIQFVERHLADPELSPTMVATHLRITSGYLHRVFSRESETLSRYILRRRLIECARVLKDPLQTGRSVTEIAFGSGFNSQSHFCRVFRERYGMSPSEYRLT